MTKLYDLFRPMADTLLSSSSEEEVQEKEKISAVLFDVSDRPFFERFDSSTVVGVIGLIFLVLTIFVFISIIYLPKYQSVSARERRHSTYHY